MSLRHLALVLAVVAHAGCATPAPRAPSRSAMAADDPASPGAVVVARRPGRTELAEGLIVERVPLRAPAAASVAPAAGALDSLLTLLRIDPARWRLRLLTAAAHGGARTAPEWARAFQLVAVVNAALYLPDQRSIGLMVDGEVVNNPRDNSKLAGFLAFSPRRQGLPPVRIFGRDCPGFDLDQVRAMYASVVQNYRMLDCDGQPVPWRDPKRYGIAGIALDRAGWVVFLHCTAPLRVNDLNVRLAAADLDLLAAVFVEGGRQASLHAATDRGRIDEVGADAGVGALAVLPRAFWPIPNVIGVVPR